MGLDYVNWKSQATMVGQEQDYKCVGSEGRDRFSIFCQAFVYILICIAFVEILIHTLFCVFKRER